MDITLDSNTLVIPRGLPGLAPIKLDMSKIYEVEGRIQETRYANPHTAIELTALFNEASGLASKYIAWINYEILQAEKEFDMCKAVVILDKLPEQLAKIKTLGIKPNEDYRNALITKDPECQKALDVLNGLKSVREFVESKHKLFERSYYSCRNVMAQPIKYTPINTNTGSTFEPQRNFMGADETNSESQMGSLVDESVIKYFKEQK